MRKFFSISVSELIEVIVSDLTFNTSSKIWESFVVVFPSDSKTLSLRHKKETLQADEINKKDHREKLSLSISYFFFKKEKKRKHFTSTRCDCTSGYIQKCPVINQSI